MYKLYNHFPQIFTPQIISNTYIKISMTFLHCYCIYIRMYQLHIHFPLTNDYFRYTCKKYQ